MTNAFGKQSTPESIEGGLKLGFSLEDFFSPEAKPVHEYTCQGFTTKTTINLWEGFHETLISAVEDAMKGKEGANTMMLVQMATFAMPFYMTELQGKVDVDLDPEDIAKLFKLPMAQTMNMNANTILSSATPFTTNDDVEMILDPEGIWNEFPDHTKWTENTRDCAVEAVLDTFAEGYKCIEEETELPARY